MRLSAVSVESLPSGQTWARICKGRVNDTLDDYPLSPGHIRHPSTVRFVCGLFAAENRGYRSIALRVPQGVGVNRTGCEVRNQRPWTVERFANMFANQSTVHVRPTDIY